MKSLMTLLTLSLLVLSTNCYAGNCGKDCEKEDKDKKNITYTQAYQGPTGQYTPVMQPVYVYGTTRPWHFGMFAGRTARALRGCYVPPRWQAYQLLQPVQQ